MLYKLYLNAICSWEQPMEYMNVYDVSSIEELAYKSFHRLKEVLHYIYKNLESPLNMDKQISNLLQITVLKMQDGKYVESKIDEDLLRAEYLKIRYQRIKDWKVA